MRVRRRFGMVERNRLARKLAGYALVSDGLRLIEDEGLPADCEAPTVLPWDGETSLPAVDVEPAPVDLARIAQLSVKYGMPVSRIVALAAARGGRFFVERARG